MPTPRLCHGLLLVALLVAPAAGAAPRTFDVLTFEPPPGWRVANEDAGQIKYELIDQASGSWCMAAVYASRPAGADPVSDWGDEWKGIVQQSFDAPGAPSPTRGTSAAGVPFLRGEADVKTSVGPARVELTVFVAGGRTTSLLAAASSRAFLDAHRRELRALADGLRMPGAGAPAVAAAPPAAAPAPGGAASIAVSGEAPRPGDPGTWKGKGIVGVWMGMVAEGLGSYAPVPRWWVFFADGVAFKDLPDSGLLGFDRAQSRSGPRAAYWSPYTFDGAKGLAKKPDEKFGTRLAVDGPDRLKLDSDVFLRVVNVDGLKLDGAWTSYANPGDPALDQLPVGQRPVIHFTREGRFVDDGLFAAFIHSGFGPEAERFDTPGEGTYEIRDYTLVLRYADGRVRREAFSGLLGADPRKNAEVIAIHRSLLHKRSGR